MLTTSRGTFTKKDPFSFSCPDSDSPSLYSLSVMFGSPVCKLCPPLLNPVPDIGWPFSSILSPRVNLNTFLFFSLADKNLTSLIRFNSVLYVESFCESPGLNLKANR